VTYDINDQCLWKQNYSKICCVENDFNVLISKIDENLVKRQREVSYQRHDLPSFAPIFDDSDTSDINDLHEYLRTSVGFNNRELAKENFLDISRARFQDKKNIQEFKDNYNKYDMKSILNWYTRETFLFKVTNNCLRVATYDSILYCRLILSDLEKAIKEQYEKESTNFNGLVYRGTYLSEQEWDRLKKNTGKDIEMHGFLSTTKHKRVAFKFLSNDLNKKALITIVVLPQSGNEEQGFAEVKDFSIFPGEEEILFNVRSRFTVLEGRMEKGPKGQEYRHLILLYGGFSWRKKISEKNPSYDITISKEGICSFCQTSLLIVGQEKVFATIENKSNYYCKNCVQNATEKFPLLFFNLGKKLENKSDHEIKLEVFGEILRHQQKDIPFYFILFFFLSEDSVATPPARSAHTVFHKCTIYEHTAHNRINLT